MAISSSTLSSLQDVQIGDYVPKAGIYTDPGVIKGITPEGSIIVSTDPVDISYYHRHTITTGMKPEEKDLLNSILDEVKSLAKDQDKMNALQFSIDDLKKNSASKKVTDMLSNEQARLIRSARELPRIYEIRAEKLR
jgi:hypothetical protein